MIDPRIDLTRCGRPAQRIGHLRLNHAHALMAVLKQPFEPFRVQTARTGFQRDLIFQRAHLARAAGLIADENRRFLTAFGAFDRTRNAAQRVEVMIDRGDAQLDRFKVLIGQIDIFQRRLQKPRILMRLAIHAIGKALARLIGIGQLILFAPSTAIDQLVDIGAIGTLGIGKDPQTGLFHAHAHLGRVIQRMGAHEIHMSGLIGCCRLERRLGQHPCLQGQQIAEDTRQGHHHIDARAAKLFQRDQIGTTQPPIAIKARLGAHQGKRLCNRAAIGFDVIRPPQHQRDGTRHLARRLDQALRLLRAIL